MKVVDMIAFFDANPATKQIANKLRYLTEEEKAAIENGTTDEALKRNLAQKFKNLGIV